MTLRVIATGSQANCYVLCAGGKALLLDAGVSYRRIVEAAGSYSDIVGCILTHEHGDHSKAAKDLAAVGIPVLAGNGTLEAVAKGSVSSCFKPVRPLQKIRLDGFTVMPFETVHDAAEPFGYLIRYEPTGETVLYATDTHYLKYTYPGVHYWIVECNFIDELLDEMDESLRRRIKASHMSLRRLKEALAANDLSKTRQIVLVHLSDERSDEARMVREIEGATGIPTTAARAGQVIELSLSPF